MITAYWISPTGIEQLETAEAPTGRPGFLWLISNGRDAEADRSTIERLFAPPPETVAEILARRHPPKLEGLGDDAFFLLLRGLDAGTTSLEFGTIQIAMLVGQDMLYTRHSGRSPSIERVLDRCREEPDATPMPVLTALQIADVAFNRFIPIVLAIEQRLEELEDVLFEQVKDNVLEELTGYRTALKRLRRITAYHQSTLGELGKSRLAADDRRSKRLLRECADNLERTGSLQSLFHDLCGDLIDSYLALAAHRLNDIMKVLTIVTAIFVPLGFLAGIYGMNFEFMPELGFRYGYFILLGTMGTVAGSLLLLFRRFRWL